MTKMKQVTAKLLVTAMCISTLASASGVEAAVKKPKLSKKSITVQTGKTVKLTVKRAAKAKITWKSSRKKTAKVKKTGKYSCRITGVKKGTAVITCKVKKGKKKYSLKCKVKVVKRKDKKDTVPTASLAPAPTSDSTDSLTPTACPEVSGTPAPAPTSSPDVMPSAAPTAIPTTTPTLPPYSTDNIRSAYGQIFNYTGSCVTSGQLANTDTLSFVKKHYNSITMENEMKPDAILGGRAVKLTRDAALEKGYFVPDNYTENYVPQLNFDKVDEALQTAYESGIKMRAHTLVWHSQTPQWFFTSNYNGSTLVDKTVMDARLEFYINTVMSHIMDKEIEITGEAGTIVYAWDVVNEYLHRSYGPDKTWHKVYNDPELQPTYVKKAFELAYKQLEKYNVQDKVVLFNNDFDTYFNAAKMVKIVNYINKDETDSNGNPVNICGGIGMQSHLDIDRPTIEQYSTALDKFIATGLEIQITELDVTINWDNQSTYTYLNENQTNEDQAAFIKDFMKMLVSKQKNRDTSVNPKGITSLTIWGLCDAVSWRGAYQNGGNSQPTLFGDSINDPKPSYTEFINASALWFES